MSLGDTANHVEKLMRHFATALLRVSKLCHSATKPKEFTVPINRSIYLPVAG